MGFINEIIITFENAQGMMPKSFIYHLVLRSIKNGKRLSSVVLPRADYS